MSKELIGKVNRVQELRGNRLLIARELAFRADNAGVVCPTAYVFLALRVHCCPRTAIRCVDDLAHKYTLITKIMRRTGRSRYAINQYRFTFRLPPKTGAHPFSCDSPGSSKAKVAQILTTTRSFGPEFLSLAEEIRRIEKGMRWWSPDSEMYAECAKNLAHLRSLTYEATQE